GGGEGDELDGVPVAEDGRGQRMAEVHVEATEGAVRPDVPEPGQLVVDAHPHEPERPHLGERLRAIQCGPHGPPRAWGGPGTGGLLGGASCDGERAGERGQRGDEPSAAHPARRPSRISQPCPLSRTHAIPASDTYHIVLQGSVGVTPRGTPWRSPEGG